LLADGPIAHETSPLVSSARFALVAPTEKMLPPSVVGERGAWLTLVEVEAAAAAQPLGFRQCIVPRPHFRGFFAYRFDFPAGGCNDIEE